MKTFLKIIIKLLIYTGILALLGAGVLKYLVFGVHTNVKTDIGLKKTNAVWMAHEWVQTPQSKEKIHSLLSGLISNDISLVFLHTGPIEENGVIPPDRYPEAKSFLETAKRFAPDIKFHAWIGQTRDALPIENPEVRGNIIEDAMHLIKDVGFDGIHINIEPMQSDPDFALLLSEMDAEFEKNAITAEISAAVSPIVPETYLKALKLIYGDKFFGHDLNRTYSSFKYTKELAENLDYIALMSYDTSFKDEEIYKWFMEQEMIYLLKAAPEKALMGIPSYEDIRDNFDPSVENVKNALEGIEMGLKNIRTNPDNLAGLSIYAVWTTDSGEWKIWREKWLGVKTDR